jgi:hypothetical protein
MEACPHKRWEVFMAKEAWVDNTHVRVTSEDGRTSYLYEVDSVGERTCTEIAERRADGTTDSKMPSRALDDLFWGARSAHK